MTDQDFAPDVAQGIITHMNEDHADAVLMIAQVQGASPAASSARLLAIAPDRLDIAIGVSDSTQHITIPFDPPVAPLNTVRARLVAMTKSARAALAEPND